MSKFKGGRRKGKGNTSRNIIISLKDKIGQEIASNIKVNPRLKKIIKQYIFRKLLLIKPTTLKKSNIIDTRTGSKGKGPYLVNKAKVVINPKGKGSIKVSYILIINYILIFTLSLACGPRERL